MRFPVVDFVAVFEAFWRFKADLKGLRTFCAKLLSNLLFESLILENNSLKAFLKSNRQHYLFEKFFKSFKNLNRGLKTHSAFVINTTKQFCTFNWQKMDLKFFVKNSKFQNFQNWSKKNFVPKSREIAKNREKLKEPKVSNHFWTLFLTSTNVEMKQFSSFLILTILTTFAQSLEAQRKLLKSGFVSWKQFQSFENKTYDIRHDFYLKLLKAFYKKLINKCSDTKLSLKSFLCKTFVKSLWLKLLGSCL